MSSIKLSTVPKLHSLVQNKTIRTFFSLVARCNILCNNIYWGAIWCSTCVGRFQWPNVMWSKQTTLIGRSHPYKILHLFPKVLFYKHVFYSYSIMSYGRSQVILTLLLPQSQISEKPNTDDVPDTDRHRKKRRRRRKEKRKHHQWQTSLLCMCKKGLGKVKNRITLVWITIYCI